MVIQRLKWGQETSDNQDWEVIYFCLIFGKILFDFLCEITKILKQSTYNNSVSNVLRSAYLLHAFIKQVYDCYNYISQGNTHLYQTTYDIKT